MGTRAAFWIGNPRDKDNREWLGCKAWDGYPQNPELEAVLSAGTEDEFRAEIALLHTAIVMRGSDDFAGPDGGWPYPWIDDVFLTDYTYAFFGGETRVTCFHRGFLPASEVTRDGFEWPEGPDDPTLRGVAIDKPYDRNQPDSIMILRIP